MSHLPKWLYSGLHRSQEAGSSFPFPPGRQVAFEIAGHVLVKLVGGSVAFPVMSILAHRENYVTFLSPPFCIPEVGERLFAVVVQLLLLLRLLLNFSQSPWYLIPNKWLHCQLKSQFNLFPTVICTLSSSGGITIGFVSQSGVHGPFHSSFALSLCMLFPLFCFVFFSIALDKFWTLSFPSLPLFLQ